MNSKRLYEILDYLDMYDTDEFNEYLKDINISKILDDYEKIKEKSNVETALEILPGIIGEAKKVGCISANDIKEINEGLLDDDDLIEFISNVEKPSKFVKTLQTTLNVSEDKEEDEEDVEKSEEKDLKKLIKDAMIRFNIEGKLDEEYKKIKEYSNNTKTLEQDRKNKVINNAYYEFYKYIINKYIDCDLRDIPLYNDDEEKEVFRKYNYLMMKLELYIYANRYKPEFENFIEYVEKLKQETKRGFKIKNQSKDSFIVRAIGELYRNTDEEALVNIKKDKTLSSLVDDMKEIRDDIHMHNVRLVRSISKKFINRGLPLEDLDQEGSIGLDKAINKFDVSKGLKFSTYATWWIKQAERRALANEGTTIRLPVHLYERANKIRNAKRLLREQEEIDEPNIDDIYEKCQELGYDLTYEQIKQYLDADLKSTPISADKYVGEDDDASLIDFLTSDSDEKTEEYAEKENMKEQANKVLDDIASGKLKGKKDYQNTKIGFKQLTFYTKEGDPIKIILLNDEFDSLRKDLKGENPKEKLIEFLDKYGIDQNDLTFGMQVENFNMTSIEREVLIYRYRTGLANEFSDKFLSRRNYNKVLFEEGNKDILTLEKAGILFGVTRERIRQLESKIRRKVDYYTGRRTYKSSVNCFMHIGTNENIYNLLGVSQSNNEYTIIAKPNTSVCVRDDGTIVPMNEGNVTIYLKNIVSGIMRELNITVNPAAKDSIKCFVSQRKLTLKLDEKKDSQ